MDEAELCDRVVLMHEGRAMARGTPEEVTALFPRRLRRGHRAATASEAGGVCGARDLAGIEVLRFGDSLHVVHDADDAPAPTLAARLAGLRRERRRTGRPAGIEDVFVALIAGTPVAPRGGASMTAVPRTTPSCARGLTRRFGDFTAVDAVSTWRCSRARSSASSAPTAPARPPPSACSDGLLAPSAGEAWVAGVPVATRRPRRSSRASAT